MDFNSTSASHSFCYILPFSVPLPTQFLCFLIPSPLHPSLRPSLYPSLHPSLWNSRSCKLFMAENRRSSLVKTSTYHSSLTLSFISCHPSSISTWGLLPFSILSCSPFAQYVVQFIFLLSIVRKIIQWVAFVEHIHQRKQSVDIMFSTEPEQWQWYCNYPLLVISLRKQFNMS